MPAIRKNDRSGPGIRNSDDDGDARSSGGIGLVAERSKAGGAFFSAVCADAWVWRIETANRMERQIGGFTAGFLSEPARPTSPKIGYRCQGVFNGVPQNS